ncbi:hypothetical protein XELAEV_18035996mg, partial [Xenopus laevis]
SNQLSPGAIAGIVIGVLFIVALIPLTIFFILRKKNNKKTPTPSNPVYENTGPQAPNTYDRVIVGSKENMAESKPQESGYQVHLMAINIIIHKLLCITRIIIWSFVTFWSHQCYIYKCTKEGSSRSGNYQR